MSNILAEKQAQAKAHLEKQNPTVAPGKTLAERQRIPLSVPMRKLEVPEIPGYYTKWFRGTPQRLAQAERAGFEYVHPDEVALNNVSLGGDATKAGNTDMGSRVSVIEGSEVDGSGQAVRMYLMKQRMEYKIEDDAINQARNDEIARTLTGQTGFTEQGEQRVDVDSRYVDRKRTKIPDLFRKKVRRG